MESGLVFNIQKYSLHDGPGIRTTVFLKGCPLRCAWCHNPESISPRREMLIVESRCIDCHECRSACPNETIIPGEGVLPPRSAECSLCGSCVDACPTAARQVVGTDLTADQVLDVVRQDQAFYEESKGGVTFSGGEPLLQPRFLRSLLSASRARGLHTAVDTCGFAPLEDLLSIASLADLLLYDVKSMDDEKHREFTGVSNRRILDNLIALGRTNVDIWVRIPLVPGFNDQDHEMAAIAQFVSAVPQVKQVNILPFHRAGAQKELRLGRAAGMKHVQTPSGEELDRAAAIFRHAGLSVRTGG